MPSSSSTKRKSLRFKSITLKDFDDFTPPERRVIIAKDVLGHLKAKRLKAYSGFWLAGEENSIVEGGLEDNFRDILRERKEPCYGCALGAICMATALRFNEVTVKDVVGPVPYWNNIQYSLQYEDFAGFLGKFFDAEQVGTIECCFELGEGNFKLYNYPICTNWIANNRQKSHTYRLRSIMLNIIRNKGTFVP